MGVIILLALVFSLYKMFDAVSIMHFILGVVYISA